MKVDVILTEEGRSVVKQRELLPVESEEAHTKLSHPKECSSIFHLEFDEQAVFEWHNPPNPQYIIVLEGELQIQLKDGSTYNYGAGKTVLADDVTGTGHRTIATKAGCCLVVNL